MNDISNCLVLGGSGFLGSYLVDRLVELEHNVTVFDLNKQTSTIFEPNTIKKISFHVGNFSNDEDIKLALKNVEYVFHFITTTIPATSNKNPIADLESNVARTVRLLELCRNTDSFKKIIFISSGGTVYGIPKTKPISEDHPTDPICAYGIGKLAIEKYLHFFNFTYGLEYTILRCSAAYGERQDFSKPLGAIGVFLNRLADEKPIAIWGDGKIVRDFIHAEDVASACTLAMKDGRSKIYNVGSGSSVTLNDLLREIEKELNIKPDVEYQHSRSFDVSDNTLDISLIKKELSWEPKISLSMGIKRVWDRLVSKQTVS